MSSPNGHLVYLGSGLFPKLDSLLFWQFCGQPSNLEINPFLPKQSELASGICKVRTPTEWLRWRSGKGGLVRTVQERRLGRSLREKQASMPSVRDKGTDVLGLNQAPSFAA